MAQSGEGARWLRGQAVWEGATRLARLLLAPSGGALLGGPQEEQGQGQVPGQLDDGPLALALAQPSAAPPEDAVDLGGAYCRNGSGRSGVQQAWCALLGLAAALARSLRQVGGLGGVCCCCGGSGQLWGGLLSLPAACPLVHCAPQPHSCRAQPLAGTCYAVLSLQAL